MISRPWQQTEECPFLRHLAWAAQFLPIIFLPWIHYNANRNYKMTSHFLITKCSDNLKCYLKISLFFHVEKYAKLANKSPLLKGWGFECLSQQFKLISEINVVGSKRHGVKGVSLNLIFKYDFYTWLTPSKIEFEKVRDRKTWILVVQSFGSHIKNLLFV